MCTLTFIPGDNGNYGIASNRDEGMHRSPSLPPEVVEWEGQKLLFPKDPDGGGTWLAISEKGRLACLLNGAFGRHKHQPPYRMSRGQVVLQQFQLSSPCQFYDKYSLDGIEPFTLIMIEPQPKLNITEVKWDGSRKHLKWIDPKVPQIWSSEMLYEPQDISYRHNLFRDWLQENPSADQLALRDFHLVGRNNDAARGIFKNTGGLVSTVSLTSIQVTESEALMKHENFRTNQDNEMKLLLKYDEK